MTENPLDLHVVGRTADGFLWHTIRRSTGSWTAFGDVLDVVNLSSLRGHVVDVACGRRAAIAAPGNVEGLYVLVAFENEPPRLLFRSSNDGSWSQQPGAFFPTSRKVAVGTFTSTPQGGGMGLNQIHMAAVTDDGHLLTALANATETQPVQLLDDVETMAGETGQLRAVALDSIVTAGSQSSVPLLAVTAKAELLWTRGHGATIADPSGTWTPWLEVVVGTAERRVPADAIDADFADGSVVAVTGDGHVWLAQAVTPGISGAWRLVRNHHHHHGRRHLQHRRRQTERQWAARRRDHDQWQIVASTSHVPDRIALPGHRTCRRWSRCRRLHRRRLRLTSIPWRA
jgi:hypothetical protein